MSQHLSRIVWITGASSGIGSELCLEFARQGDFVVLSSRNESALLDLQARIETSDGKSKVVLCDVRDKGSVSNATDVILKTVGKIDVLINNAGITVFKKFLHTSMEEFDDILATNLKGSFLTTQSVLPSMMERKNGLVINLVSYAAKVTYTESSVYSAAKAGLAAMMDGVRAEVRTTGVKIVNVFPGAVRTPIWPPKLLTKYGDQMVSPAEVAKVVCQITHQDPSLMVEEITIRPQEGDLHE
jgi:NADP-dependent 3-hydroxy acid dehydrogenase YdfG